MSASFSVIVELCTSVVLLFMERTPWAVGGEAMCFEVGECDPDTALCWRVWSPLLVIGRVVLRLVDRLRGVHKATVLCEGSCFNGHSPLHVSSGPRRQPENCFGSNNVTAGDSNKIVVAAEGSS